VIDQSGVSTERRGLTLSTNLLPEESSDVGTWSLDDAFEFFELCICACLDNDEDVSLSSMIDKG